jgi:hypothetical protein
MPCVQAEGYNPAPVTSAGIGLPIVLNDRPGPRSGAETIGHA